MRARSLTSISLAFGGLLLAQEPAFEVASIKLNKPGPMALQRVNLRPGERVTMINVTARILIQVAFEVADDKIQGGPGWLSTNRFDVVAKAESPESVERLRLMLKSLLRERFGLKTHTEM